MVSGTISSGLVPKYDFFESICVLILFRFINNFFGLSKLFLMSPQRLTYAKNIFNNKPVRRNSAWQTIILSFDENNHLLS